MRLRVTTCSPRRMAMVGECVPFAPTARCPRGADELAASGERGVFAVGPLRRRLDRRTRLRLQRKGLGVDGGAAKVLPADTTLEAQKARVVVDFGEAVVEGGRTVGGEIIEIDLEQVGNDFRVARVGFATFAD